MSAAARGEQWLVLKNRRQEGPFSQEALLAAFEKGRFSPDDYVISTADSEAGLLNYFPLKKILNLAAKQAIASTPPKSEPEAVPAPPPKAKPQTPADLRLLNTFELNEFVPATAAPSKSQKKTLSAPKTSTRAWILGASVLTLAAVVGMNPDLIGLTKGDLQLKSVLNQIHAKATEVAEVKPEAKIVPEPFYTRRKVATTQVLRLPGASVETNGRLQTVNVPESAKGMSLDLPPLPAAEEETQSQ